MKEDPGFEFVEAVLRERSDAQRTVTDPDVLRRLMGGPRVAAPTKLELETERSKRGYNPYDTTRPAR